MEAIQYIAELWNNTTDLNISGVSLLLKNKVRKNITLNLEEKVLELFDFNKPIVLDTIANTTISVSDTDKYINKKCTRVGYTETWDIIKIKFDDNKQYLVNIISLQSNKFTE